MSDVRDVIVAWAKWAETHKGQPRFNYSEGANRMEGVHKPGVLPWSGDCSAFVTCCYSWAGAADPNGQGFDGQGYTGTLISHGHEIDVKDAQPGDVVVYGPGTGEHTALIVEGGIDPLTVSMGENGDPSFVRVSQDGRMPQRYFRYPTLAVNPVHLPPVPAPSPVTPPKSPVKPVTPAPVQPSTPVQKKAPSVPVAVQKILNAAKPDNPNTFRPTIHFLCAGPNVSYLQKCLGLRPNGVFGTGTRKAVVAFQAKHGLFQDGIVGAETWAAIGKFC